MILGNIHQSNCLENEPRLVREVSNGNLGPFQGRIGEFVARYDDPSLRRVHQRVNVGKGRATVRPTKDQILNRHGGYPLSRRLARTD